METKKILIVDDEPSMRMALSESLDSCGYETEAVSSGEEALKIFDRDVWDMVITDMRMPGISGMDVLRGIRNKTRETPVILITAYGTVGTAVDAMKEGATEFIMKPFSSRSWRVPSERYLLHPGGWRRHPTGQRKCHSRSSPMTIKCGNC